MRLRLTGESVGLDPGVVRYLTDELAIPRDQVSVLGYWTLGGPIAG